MKKETFVRQKQKELEKYGERMRKTYKRFGKCAVAFSVNNRRARALAAGECVLKALDELVETAAKKPLVKGGVSWFITEIPQKDANGKKEFRYEVGFSALSMVREYTDEQITEELNKTWEKMQMEIDERFPEEDEDGKDQGRD